MTVSRSRYRQVHITDRCDRGEAVMVQRLCAIAFSVLVALAPLSVARAASLDLTPSNLGISGASLTSNPSTTLRVGGYASLTLYVQHTRVSATAVNVSCTAGPTTTLQAPLGVASVNSTTGAITMSQASWTYPVTASSVLRIIVAPINDVFFVCTFTGTAAAAGDVISLYARLGGVP